MIRINSTADQDTRPECASCRKNEKVYDVRIGDTTIHVCLRCLEKLGDKILQVSIEDDLKDVEI